MRRTVSEASDMPNLALYSVDIDADGEHAETGRSPAVLDDVVGPSADGPSSSATAERKRARSRAVWKPIRSYASSCCTSSSYRGSDRSTSDVRKRNVQEEADRLCSATLPQFPAERDQMVVVHPDEVIRRAAAAAAAPANSRLTEQ